MTEPTLTEQLNDFRERLNVEDEQVKAAALEDAINHLPKALPKLVNYRAWRGNAEDIEAAILAACEADPNKAEGVLLQATSEPGEAQIITTDWTAAPAERTWLIPGWLPAGRVGLATGTGGAGKSRLALQLAAPIAAGERDWLPNGGPALKTQDPAPAVLATWEDEPDELARRLPGSNHAAGRGRDFGGRLHGLDFAGCGPLWGPPEGAPASTPGELAPAGKWLRAYCEEHRPRLLVVDPLAAAFACNENDRGIVRQFMSDWDGWARAAECAVLFVAHPSKSTPEYSGSTDWQAAARFVWTLGVEKDAKAPRLVCTKRSYGRRPAPLWLHGYPDWSVTNEKSAALDWQKVTDKADMGEFKPIVEQEDLDDV